MAKRTNKQCRTSSGFVRKTLTLPGDLESFFQEQQAKPQHAGNASSYVRSLIIADRLRQSEKSEKAA